MLHVFLSVCFILGSLWSWEWIPYVTLRVGKWPFWSIWDSFGYICNKSCLSGQPAGCPSYMAKNFNIWHFLDFGWGSQGQQKAKISWLHFLAHFSTHQDEIWFGFEAILLLLLCSQAISLGWPFWVRFLLMWRFRNPANEVVTFCLRGFEAIQADTIFWSQGQSKANSALFSHISFNWSGWKLIWCWSNSSWISWFYFE